jgi:uncharacterized membrane protein YraQ (UPF0718 family)/copper chaperone CopZ
MIHFLSSFIQSFIEEFWSLCIETAPYLLLGMFFSGLIYIFIDSKFILKHIGSKSLSSILKSTLMGIPIPLCSCGVIPVASTIRNSGASKGSTVSFLISTPQTGIDSIFMTYGMMGPVFAIFRPFAAFISGIISGIVVNRFDDESHNHVSKNYSNQEKVNLIERLKIGFNYGFVVLPSDILVPLLQGLSVAAFISIVIPPDFIATYFSDSKYLVFILMLFISLPIYVCATASVPIAVALMAKGVSAGAVFVFLMAGPATNASSIAVVKKILGKKVMFLYLFLVATISVFFGIVFDLFLRAELPISLHHHAHDHGQNYFSTILAISFILLMINAYFNKSRTINMTNFSENTKFNDKLSLIVKGMTCSHCKQSVENGLGNIPEVENTIVNLETGQVIIQGDKLDKDAITTTIENLGFSIK